MKTFFQKYLIEIIIIGIVIAIGLHFWNPIKDLFNHTERSQRVEDTPVFKSLEKERDNWKDSTAYYKGLHEQLVIDYNNDMNKLPEINSNYHSSIKQIKKMTHGELDDEYNKYLIRQNAELKNEGER